MNIFEILSAGNRVLKEEHISSVLGWMLDPYHDHGLGMELLKRIVEKHFEPTSLAKLVKEGEFSGLVMRERERLSVRTELELRVGKGVAERSIDILITINDRYRIAIENKTSRGSIQVKQLKEEVEGLKARFNAPSDELYFIFLTPPNSGDDAARALELIPPVLSAKPAHVLWRDEKGANEKTISAILNAILRDESVGITSPLSNETRFLIKSFIRFIENGFSYLKGKVERAPTKEGSYYEGVAEGLAELWKFEETGESLFIGYDGEVRGLRARLETAQGNQEKREAFEKRLFKVSKVQHNTNWIPIKEFVTIVKEYGF